MQRYPQVEKTPSMEELSQRIIEEEIAEYYAYKQYKLNKRKESQKKSKSNWCCCYGER
jgi:hypothetical protein